MRITGVSKTIADLKTFRADLYLKNREFLRRLAEIGIDVATATFSSAQYDGTNDVEVADEPEWVSDQKLRIIASGGALYFIEFGTGVHYTESHPKAGEFGAVRGAYGHGLGRLDSWRYQGDPGTNGEYDPSHPGYVLTHGNPPARGMYDAAMTIRQSIIATAKEVYR